MSHRTPLLLALALAAPAAAQSPASARGPIGTALDAWRAENGSAWQVHVDARSRRASFVYGYHTAAPAVAPRDEGDFLRLARERLVDSAPLTGLEPETLVPERALMLPLAQYSGSSDKMTVRFSQSVNGVPVEGGFANVLFDMEGRMLAFQGTALPDVADLNTVPTLVDRDATRLATGAFEALTGLAAQRVGTPRLVIISAESGESVEPALCWRVEVGHEQPDTVPELQALWIAADDGRVARAESMVHHLDVGGQVVTKATPGVLPDSGFNPAVDTPAAYISVSSDQGTVQADASGNFNFPGETNLTGVSVSYNGPWASVDDNGGADYVLNVGNLSGTGNTLVMNPVPDEFTTGESNAYVNAGIFRDWVRSINPLDGTMDFVNSMNVNQSSTCNAFFDGSSTNYFNAGGGCVNTSYSTVVGHETGHWANVVYGTGNSSDGTGEGTADIWAMYIYDDPQVAADFFGPGTNIRTGTNTNPFCGVGCSGCYGGAHPNGEPLMGAAWKVRVNLKASLGDAAGGLQADSIFLGYMSAFDQTSLTEEIPLQWLTVDDDNGNLADGTPNSDAIIAGFEAQGFPVGVPVTVTLTTLLPNTTDTAGPYAISVEAPGVDSMSGGTIEVFYRAYGAPAFISSALTQGGGSTWTGSIPGQPGGSLIEYYVSADSGGGTGTAPADAPDNTYTFAVGDVVVMIEDDFESDLGWTVQDTSVSTGTWERADPNGTDAAPEDDNSPLGTLCYVTGNGAPGESNGTTDVDGGPTVLTSPSLDLSSGDAFLSFAIWHSNDDGDDPLVIEMSNDDGGSWSTVEVVNSGPGGGCGGGSGGASDGWSSRLLLVSDVLPPTGTVRVRFSIADSPNDSITEAALDDFRVFMVDDPSPVRRYCDPAQPNETGSPATLSATGSFSVSTNDVVFTVSPLAAGNTGLIAYSPDVTRIALGNGYLCLGNDTLGFVLRLPGESPQAGIMTHDLDISNPPVPGLGEITAGSTWNFQSWNRDFTPGGEGFNFSDALEITFLP